MDGGVRQGTDVLKALAMGAKAVFIGRPVLWGLAYKVFMGFESGLDWTVVLLCRVKRVWLKLLRY